MDRIKTRTRIYPLLFMLAIPFQVFSQSYTSYFTGSSSDVVTKSGGGICLMGGATENDEAMKWFLNRANHGDVLVLRASGTDGYNDYLYKDLGVEVNSVESIVFLNTDASKEAYIHEKIKQAEAIWIAGGDQWDYVTYWRHTSIDSLLNDAIHNRHVVIGGTSAGMAIMGGFYYSASHESETSAEALADPYNSNMSVDSTRFITNAFLEHVITDTHYDGRNRMGRHVAFMARIFADWKIEPRGIACEEYSAVCIDTTGIAHCYGGGPQKKDYTYFLQVNCELTEREPEICIAGSPLSWDRGNQALKVYKVNGNATGENTFDLNDWISGIGGAWEDWYVDSGNLVKQSGSQMNCSQTTSLESVSGNLHIYPNPAYGGSLIFRTSGNEIKGISIIDLSGKIVRTIAGQARHEVVADIAELNKGVYLVVVETRNDTLRCKVVLQ
jgi:cyanophycinase-like exopeptidase